MTDEEIEFALEQYSLAGGRNVQNVDWAGMLDYIHRLKAENEDLYFQNQNLQTYIDNHEKIWKCNAEIGKAQVRKDTAKEILVKWWKENIATGNEYGNDYVDELVLDYGLDYDDFRTSIEVDDE
jgi:hypothetical protein